MKVDTISMKVETFFMKVDTLLMKVNTFFMKVDTQSSVFTFKIIELGHL